MTDNMIIIGLVMIGVGLLSVLYSTNYANESASNSVTDIILSNTRVYDVEMTFVYGAMIAIILSIIIFLTIKVAYLPFALKSTAVFLVIRSVFVSLTHISPYPSHILGRRPLLLGPCGTYLPDRTTSLGEESRTPLHLPCALDRLRARRTPWTSPLLDRRFRGFLYHLHHLCNSEEALQKGL